MCGTLHLVPKATTNFFVLQYLLLAHKEDFWKVGESNSILQKRNFKWIVYLLLFFWNFWDLNWSLATSGWEAVVIVLKSIEGNYWPQKSTNWVNVQVPTVRIWLCLLEPWFKLIFKVYTYSMPLFNYNALEQIESYQEK